MTEDDGELPGMVVEEETLLCESPLSWTGQPRQSIGSNDALQENSTLDKPHISRRETNSWLRSEPDIGENFYVQPSLLAKGQNGGTSLTMENLQQSKLAIVDKEQTSSSKQTTCAASCRSNHNRKKAEWPWYDFRGKSCLHRALLLVLYIIITLPVAIGMCFYLLIQGIGVECRLLLHPGRAYVLDGSHDTSSYSVL